MPKDSEDIHKSDLWNSLDDSGLLQTYPEPAADSLLPEAGGDAHAELPAPAPEKREAKFHSSPL